MTGAPVQDAVLGEKDFPLGLKGLVFDVDGVLFDSRDSNMLYYNSIRGAVGLPPLSAEEEAFCQMASVDESLNAIFPPELLATAYEACRGINYREKILPMLSLEPGLVETLYWLKQNGIRSAIFTNRSTSVEELLAYFALENFFSPVKTASTGRPKPYPDGLQEILREWEFAPGQIAFIGDSRVDAMAAEAAGVPFWAFRNPDLKADLHISDFFKLMGSITPLVEG